MSKVQKNINLCEKDHITVLTRQDIKSLFGEIPREQLENLAKATKVDWNVSRLRGEVVLKLLMYGILRNDRISTRVLEHMYNSPFFERFGSKNQGHKTRHSSIAERLTKIPWEYFESIFRWAYDHYTNKVHGTTKTKAVAPIYRFDSTMISISSAFVDWGMQVGRPPKEGYPKVNLKVTVGMKGLLPASAKVFFDQKELSEETALYKAITNAAPTKRDWVVFDRGLKSRKSFKKLDVEHHIRFVTRASKNCRFETVRTHSTELEMKALETEQTRFVKDSIVLLYSGGKELIQHEFRMVQIEDKSTGKTYMFITNILEMDAAQIAEIYRRRWDIEVFFRFLKQELRIKHLLSHSQNGIKVQIYVALLLAILMTVYKIQNNIPGFKIARLAFEDDLLICLVKELNSFINDS